MLSKQDLGKRLTFALKCKKLSSTFWTEGISFYLDGTGWVHKTDPCGQTRTYRTRMWRKRGEGLNQECSAKGRKEGSGGRMAKFMVAIAHGKGVIECHHYEGNINGETFSQFIRDHFPTMFVRGNNKKREIVFARWGTPLRIVVCRKMLWMPYHADYSRFPLGPRI